MSGSNVNLVIAGDSIGAGSISGADPWKNLDLGGSYTVQNHSFAGAYIGQQAGLNEGAILQSFDPNSGTNWLVVQAGTNDLAQGATASVLYTGVQKLVQDGHAQGFKVVVATILPRSDAVFAWSSADESARLAYNDTVRANAAGADAIADLAASPIMGNAAAPSNAALYLDGLHPTASAVQTYLEPIYAAVFSSSAAPAPIAQPDPTPAPVITTPPETTPAAGDAPGADTGSGSNTLVVHVSGDHYQGDPQFQVYVDGKQVGGTQTVSAVHGQNQWQDITLKGDFSPSSPHAVEVRFVNDAYDGSGQFSEGHDRNLYVGSVSLDGHSFGASEANPAVLLQNGGVTIATTAPSDTTGTGDASPSAGAGGTAPAADPSSTAPAVGGTPSADTGSGSNTLVVHVSGDHYQGDPQFQVYVDGKQVGGTQTVSAVHGQNQWQDVTLKGDFSPSSPHAVEVRFVNDAYDGSGQFSEGHDRNLYVGSVSLDGHSFGASEANPAVLLQNGGVTIATTAPSDTTGTGDASPSAGAGGTAPAADPSSTAPAVGGTPSADTGSGNNTLVVHVSGDHYQGDPQFQVYVDGKQVGGTQTVSAVHGQNQWQDVTLKGDFSPSSPHAVEVRFVNDAYDGSGQFTEGHDRNLYVGSVSLDGHSFGASEANPAVLLQNGGVTIATTAPSDTTGTGDTSPSAGAGGTAPAADPSSTTTVGSGAHQLLLKISQDAYLGDAQYMVSVDGNQVGGVQTAHASHAAGQSDTLTVKGDFGPGDHTVNVTFLNDFYGGSASADRNLYVDGASYDGKTVANSSLTLPNTGSLHFTIPGTGTGSDVSGAATVATTAAAVPAAPTVALTHDTGAGGTHVSTDGQITYAPSASGDTLHYKLDNGAVTTTAPVLATNGTADGSHTVTVYETDAAGHTSADASLVFSLQAHHDNNGFHLT